MMTAREILINGELTMERISKDALYMYKIFLTNGFSESQAEELVVNLFKNADLEHKTIQIKE